MIKKVFKQLHNNQEADYDKNYKKLFNSDRVMYPWSKSIPAINIIYTNADQFTTMKTSELLEFVERKKPHIIAICEVKPKIPREQTELDHVIPCYSLHPVNLDSNIGRGIITYTHFLIFFHQCFVGDFNFRNINWFTRTTPRNEESKKTQFIEAIHDCYLYKHLLEPTRNRSTDNPSLIDLVLTNEVMQVSDIEYHAPLGKSDHCVFIFKYYFYLDYSQPRERYVYHKTNFNSMRKQLDNLYYLTGQKNS